MTKTKNTVIAEHDLLLTTPLCVPECVQKIRDMAHFDLTIDITHQTEHSATIKFTERHNDDFPIYLSSQLMATPDGTQVSFEPEGSLKRRALLRSEKVGMVGFVVIVGGVLIYLGYIIVYLITQPNFYQVLPLLIPAAFFGWALKLRDNNKEHIRTGMIKGGMHERLEALRSDLIEALTVNSEQERYDELGNAYYLDVKRKGGQS